MVMSVYEGQEREDGIFGLVGMDENIKFCLVAGILRTFNASHSLGTCFLQLLQVETGIMAAPFV